MAITQVPNTATPQPTSGNTTAASNIGTPAGLNLINNQQVANAFTIPGADAISQNIANTANNPAQANQMQSSPLAGLTTLGTVANAGAVGAGLQQAGVTNAGLSQAGLAQAGVAQAGLANAGHTAIDTTNQNALLGGQIANINDLNNTAHGLGPSVAMEQAKRQGEQNVAQQMAMLGSQRGAANSNLGLRQAMHAKSVADQQAVQAGVQGRTQEELAAQQQLTGALGGTQGQVMQGAQAQAGLTQGVNLANQNAANTQMLQNAQFANQVGLANSGAANTQMLQNAQFGNAQELQNAAAANQVGLANMQAGNQVGLANAGATNTAMLQNAAGQNQAMLQQGQMSQQVQLANAQQQAQVALANLQAKQQTQGLNAQEQNAMIQAQMTLANNTSTSAQNYVNALMNQNIQQQGINAGLSINASNNTMGLTGAGIAGGAALGAAGVTALASDENLKTNISSGDRSVKNFLSQIAASPVASNFNLWSSK